MMLAAASTRTQANKAYDNSIRSMTIRTQADSLRETLHSVEATVEPDNSYADG